MSASKTATPISDFFKGVKVSGELGDAEVKVAIRPMTERQARQAYPYRPFSKYAESRWGGNTLLDDVCLVLNRKATRCKMCQAPTRNQFLVKGVCPDCDGTAEYNGDDPHDGERSDSGGSGESEGLDEDYEG